MTRTQGTGLVAREKFGTAQVLRLSDLPYSDEKYLLCTVIGVAMADEEAPHKTPSDWHYKGFEGGFADGWINQTLRLYCRVLNIEPVELEVIARRYRKVGV